MLCHVVRKAPIVSLLCLPTLLFWLSHSLCCVNDKSRMLPTWLLSRMPYQRFKGRQCRQARAWARARSTACGPAQSPPSLNTQMQGTTPSGQTPFSYAPSPISATLAFSPPPGAVGTGASPAASRPSPLPVPPPRGQQSQSKQPQQSRAQSVASSSNRPGTGLGTGTGTSSSSTLDDPILEANKVIALLTGPNGYFNQLQTQQSQLERNRTHAFDTPGHAHSNLNPDLGSNGFLTNSTSQS